MVGIMGILDRFKKRNAQPQVYLTLDEVFGDLTTNGYTSLDKCPEIVTGCRTIAKLVSMMTIKIMSNTDRGDVRIKNELSRKLDISPCSYMTRQTFIEKIVMDMLLYGKGNAVVDVRTINGYIDDLVPVKHSRVDFLEECKGYSILIDGRKTDPSEMLHFVFNPDPEKPWKGIGINTSIRDISACLKQERETVKGFLSSKFMPSVIVKVDALTEEFASPEGRKKLADEFVSTSKAGEPWMIPADMFDVKEVRPLSLSDLAISDAIEIDKRAAASILGVPSFVLGVGQFNKDEWNNMINSTVKVIAQGIAQEMTKKLILSNKWYVMFNIWNLYEWDMLQLVSVLESMADRGHVTGNEIRDKVGFEPREGLDELKLLENYIPYDMSGNQKKLIQED